MPFSLDKSDIRVYYQDDENKVVEAVLQPATETWVKGNANLPTAIPGTSISAVSSNTRPNQRVWVYYQLANTQPVEYLLQSNNWVVGKSNMERVLWLAVPPQNHRPLLFFYVLSNPR